LVDSETVAVVRGLEVAEQAPGQAQDLGVAEQAPEQAQDLGAAEQVPGQALDLEVADRVRDSVAAAQARDLAVVPAWARAAAVEKV
jgi:hypothetical protein